MSDNPVSQSELEAKTCHWYRVLENGCEQVVIGFGFTSESDYLFDKAKPEQSRITFDTPLKTAQWP